MSWYKESQFDGQNLLGNQNQYSDRYQFMVLADVIVPPETNTVQEKETASQVLRTVLNKINGDASLETGILANIQFQIKESQL